jgi:protein SCO1
MKSNLVKKRKVIFKIGRHVLLVSVLFFAFLSCNKKEVVAKDKPISDLSIYNLPSQWTNQNGQNIEMVDLRGKVLVMVMIYTSCKAACPRLVADMRNIESRLPENIKENVELVLVSIDPEARGGYAKTTESLFHRE